MLKLAPNLSCLRAPRPVRPPVRPPARPPAAVGMAVHVRAAVLMLVSQSRPPPSFPHPLSKPELLEAVVSEIENTERNTEQQRAKHRKGGKGQRKVSTFHTVPTTSTWYQRLILFSSRLLYIRDT